ncbi:hypothetical protein CgunFtcFv8_018910 [Champsocephalus gunnari]|uniref:Uncharacterized protein n=2 Tax=Champsocephalus gunnari TaxID=52237 RepID=A0AAN8DED1_CHAGU|nr:hypothetical protein CgunFtcFv8_018910 [Champsocephalus gunnari]
MSLKYSDHRDQIVTQIENSTAVSFTTDICTSVRMEAYMAVTCHFITQEWKLCNFVLETKVMEVNHTGVNIAEQLGEVADAFAIPNYKRVAVVHDKASNMKLYLTADQWKLAQETAEVLGPLITLTELLSQEENVLLSATMQMLFNLKRRHLSPEEDDSPAIREVKKTLVTEIDSRWKLSPLEPSSIYLLSSALDQRFKQLKFLTDEKKDLVYIEVRLIF